MDEGKKSGLQKLVERLVDERLRELLPRVEDAVLQTGRLGVLLRQEVQEKVTRVESHLEAMQREVAALRSSPCGQEQEVLRGRVQQADALTGQVQGRIAGIQAGLRNLQRKSSFEVKQASRLLEPKDATAGSYEGKATEQRSESKSVEQSPELKLSELRSESKSRGVTDNLWKMRQLLTEQFNEKSRSPSHQGCLPEEQLEREVGELRCAAGKEECNSPFGLVWQPVAECHNYQSQQDASAQEIEPPSACSTITLFDSRCDSKQTANASQGSFVLAEPA